MVGLDMDGRVKEAIAALGEVVAMTELINPDFAVEPLDTNKEVAEDGTVTVQLYDANHGKSKRTGGPYLDDVEKRTAEERRAVLEGREPDYDNPGPVAGTLLVPKSALVERDTDKAHIFESIEVTNEPVASYEVPPVVTEPDPTQADWNNDSSQVAALENAKKFEALTASTKGDYEA